MLQIPKSMTCEQRDLNGTLVQSWSFGNENWKNYADSVHFSVSHVDVCMPHQKQNHVAMRTTPKLWQKKNKHEDDWKGDLT